MKRKQICSGIRGLLRAVLLVLGVSGAAFFLLAVSPIDPLQSNVGQAALGAMSPEQIEKLKEYWGTDTPMLERFFMWLWNFIRGDMGISLLYRRPVSEVIWEKAAGSLGMMTAAWLISGALGFLLGIKSHDSPHIAPVFYRTDSSVSPCHPSRGRYYIFRIRIISGRTGYWSHSVRKYEVSGYGKMVAGIISRRTFDGVCFTVSYAGRQHLQTS